jgi:hypothetical protein
MDKGPTLISLSVPDEKTPSAVSLKQHVVTGYVAWSEWISPRFLVSQTLTEPSSDPLTTSGGPRRAGQHELTKLV